MTHFKELLKNLMDLDPDSKVGVSKVLKPSVEMSCLYLQILAN
jgi:hypothetical protein